MGLQWQHLLGHPQCAMVAGADDVEGDPQHLLAVDRPQPGRSACAGDCAHLQERYCQIQCDSQGVDPEVCNVRKTKRLQFCTEWPAWCFTSDDARGPGSRL